MTVLIIAENYDAAKVHAFGSRLFANPLEAVALAAALLQEWPTTGPQATVLRDFHALTPWEQSGALDELRDALDKLLETKFWEYTKAARAVDATEAKA